MNDDSCGSAGTCCPPDEELALPDDADDAVALLAKALAHPARARILRLLLARTSCSCGEVVAELPLAQATVSQHLRVLKDAGLVQGRIDGPRTCYCADPGRLAVLADLVRQLAETATVPV